MNIVIGFELGDDFLWFLLIQKWFWKLELVSAETRMALIAKHHLIYRVERDTKREQWKGSDMLGDAGAHERTDAPTLKPLSMFVCFFFFLNVETCWISMF